MTAPRMAVDVEVEDKPNSVKKLTIKVSSDECQNAFQAVLTKLSKQVHPEESCPNLTVSDGKRADTIRRLWA